MYVNARYCVQDCIAGHGHAWFHAWGRSCWQAMVRAKDLGKVDALKKLLPFNEDMAAALVEPEGAAHMSLLLPDSRYG